MSELFNYLDLLNRLENEHKLKVDSLIENLLKEDNLYWYKLTLDLEEIYVSFKKHTLSVVISELLTNNNQVLNEAHNMQKSFRKYCDDKFDSTHKYFANFNGIK